MKNCLYLSLVLWLVSCGSLFNSPQDHYIKALELARQNQWDEACRNLKDAIEENPNYTEAWVLLGDIETARERDTAAMNAYRMALRTGARSSLLFRWGKSALALAKYELADSVMTAYLATKPADERVLREAQRLQANAAFARVAVKNPVPFDPESLGAEVNALDMQYFPSISADAKTLVFTARNINREPRFEDFYTTVFVDGAWQSPELLLEELRTSGNEGALSLSADGKSIFFAGCNREDGFGSCDIYYCVMRADGRWSTPKNMGKNVNSFLWESQPSISPDGNILYFVRGRGSNDAHSDILYTSRNKDGSWSPAKPVRGMVNTPYAESSPFIHFDGRSMYFSSSGHPGMGERDIYVSRLQPNGEWGVPENLGYPINTNSDEFSLIVSPDGRKAIYASDRSRGGDLMHLYAFDLPEAVRATPIAWVRILVLSEKEKRPLAAQLEIVDLGTRKILVSGSAESDGRFSVSVPVHSNYALNVNMPGYIMYSENFALEHSDHSIGWEQIVYMKKIAVDGNVVLKNVFFDTDSYALRNESEVELDKLTGFLQQNPSVHIRIDGHTDNQGSISHNRTLSLNRATSVRDFLISGGIESERVEVKGFGQDRPIAENNTEEGRQLNRRIEVTVTKM